MSNKKRPQASPPDIDSMGDYFIDECGRLRRTSESREVPTFGDATVNDFAENDFIDRFDELSLGDISGQMRESGDLLDWDQLFMRWAIALAEQAASEDEVPVGAVIVQGHRVIGAGWNQREALSDPTAHAEMIAITQAASTLQSWRLESCTLYVTLEPCPMCAGAILQSRIPRVVYGAADPKAGAVDSLFRLLDDPRLNHRCTITPGMLADQCGYLLSQFFLNKRREGKK